MNDAPKVGDYVLVTKYDDGDPGDHWAVGFYAGTLPKASGDRHMVIDSYGNNFRGNGFRRVKKISAARGQWMLERADDIGQSGRSVWWWARSKMSVANQPQSRNSEG